MEIKHEISNIDMLVQTCGMPETRQPIKGNTTLDCSRSLQQETPLARKDKNDSVTVSELMDSWSKSRSEVKNDLRKTRQYKCYTDGIITDENDRK